MESLNFRKSSYSSNNGGACIETASTGRDILVRDSKAPEAGRLAVSASAWSAFTARIRNN